MTAVLNTGSQHWFSTLVLNSAWQGVTSDLVIGLRRVALAVLLALTLAACGEDEPLGPPVRGSSQEPSAPLVRPTIEVVEDSIVRIVAFGCGAPTVGTGFAVDTNLIVTNGHIITGRDPETMSVQHFDGTDFPAVLVGFDPDLDLALLRVDEASFRPLNLVTEVPVVDGVAVGIRTLNKENVINEVDFSVDAPVIVNWDGVFRDSESSYRGIRVDAEIRKGDSGSPLLINDRDAIGLIQSKNRNLPRGYAVRSSEIDVFVDSIDPSVEVVADRCA